MTYACHTHCVPSSCTLSPRMGSPRLGRACAKLSARARQSPCGGRPGAKRGQNGCAVPHTAAVLADTHVLPGGEGTVVVRGRVLAGLGRAWSSANCPIRQHPVRIRDTWMFLQNLRAPGAKSVPPLECAHALSRLAIRGTISSAQDALRTLAHEHVPGSAGQPALCASTPKCEGR